jgi:arginase
VDALDSEVMPAVDSPQPGGLTYGELIELLGTALASDLALGFQVTIFDPDLDPDGHHARRLAAALREAFVRAGRVP